LLLLCFHLFLVPQRHTGIQKIPLEPVQVGVMRLAPREGDGEQRSAE
jgi:hypothetical protein